MDETIEVEYDVAVKVVDSLGGKLTTNLFYFFYMIEAVIFKEFLFQKLCLLIKVILLYLAHEFFNFGFLVFN